MIYLEKNDVLLFQGDSITHGGRVESDWDMNHVIGHGYQDSLAQQIGLDNIDRMPQIFNRGVSGDNIETITARAETDLFALKPTILSILVGVNDAGSYVMGKSDLSPEKYEQTYRALLDRVVKELPGIRLIIGEPFRFPRDDGKDDDLAPRAIEFTRQNAMAAERIAKDYGAVFVRYRNVFEEQMQRVPCSHLIWDGVHPTYVGHAIMAKCWMETVSRAFGNGKK